MKAWIAVTLGLVTSASQTPAYPDEAVAGWESDSGEEALAPRDLLDPDVLYAVPGKPNLNQVRITSVTHAGTGCPAGSRTRVSLLRGWNPSIALQFDAFAAAIGPGTSITDRRKNCQINIGLQVPPGWSYAVSAIDYRGQAHLDAGIEGVQKSTLYFAGELPQASSTAKIAGPINRAYLVRDTLPHDGLVWSPCDAERNLNVNSQVRLSDPANTDGDGLLKAFGLTELHLRFRRCQ
jgi:hypothetical protein